jgi:hypothetical protein
MKLLPSTGYQTGLAMGGQAALLCYFQSNEIYVAL